MGLLRERWRRKVIWRMPFRYGRHATDAERWRIDSVRTFTYLLQWLCLLDCAYRTAVPPASDAFILLQRRYHPRRLLYRQLQNPALYHFDQPI